MKKVLVRAPLLTNSGYGVHSRQVFSWLLSESKKRNFEIDVECLNWGNCSWVIDEKKSNGLIGEIMKRSKPLQESYDVTFQVQLPDEWDPSLGKFNVGITAAVESDKCNPTWIDACNKMDHVIVPSTFTKNVLKRSGILLKSINVVPEWYHETIDEEIKEIDLNLTTSFNFLTIGMLTHTDPTQDRKNLVNTVSLLCKKFKDDKNVGIVVKTCLGKTSAFDRKKTREYFSQIAAAAKGSSDYPKIATNYSGHLEFMKRQPFLRVDYSLINIPEKKIDNRIFVKGTKWAEPSKESYFTKLHDVYYNYEYHKNNAMEVSKHIKENFSKNAIVQEYNKLFSEVL